MTLPIVAVLIVLLVAVILMVTELLRADLVAMLVALALALVGIITPQEAFAGLSRSAVITILAVFIMTNGLYKTGVTHHLGRSLERLAGGKPVALLALITVAGAVLSLFMNNIAAAALLLPAVSDVARRAHINPSKLLMPLAFGTILGGAATLLTTSNLLASASLVDHGLPAYHLLDFAPVGMPMAALGILYMVLVGRRLLPDVSSTERLLTGPEVGQALTLTYALPERMAQVFVPADSPLVGKTLAQSQIGATLGVTIVALCREREKSCLAPGPEQTIRAEDTLIITGRSERVARLTDMGARVLETPSWAGYLADHGIALVEVILAPRSHAVGYSLRDLHFREKYGLTAVALWRGSRSYRTDVGDMPLQFGDALLLHGPVERIAILRSEADFLVLTEAEAAPRSRKGWLAAGIAAVALLAAALNLVPIAEATMLGALAMVLTGCLSMDEAYHAVEWRAIFLVAGMLAFGVALSKSGAAGWIGEQFAGVLSRSGPLVLAAGMFLLATLLTQVISGQVAAAVLAPVAIAAAGAVGAEPRAVVMAMALGCSMSFLTPLSHPVNVLVMGPGGYRFRDFLKVGLPLVLLMLAMLLVLLPVFWPLR